MAWGIAMYRKDAVKSKKASVVLIMAPARIVDSHESAYLDDTPNLSCQTRIGIYGFGRIGEFSLTVVNVFGSYHCRSYCLPSIVNKFYLSLLV